MRVARTTLMCSLMLVLRCLVPRKVFSVLIEFGWSYHAWLAKGFFFPVLGCVWPLYFAPVWVNV